MCVAGWVARSSQQRVGGKWELAVNEAQGAHDDCANKHAFFFLVLSFAFDEAQKDRGANNKPDIRRQSAANSRALQFQIHSMRKIYSFFHAVGFYL